jgi:nitroreductase
LSSLGSLDVDVMKRRYSCRSYERTPIGDEQVEHLKTFLESVTTGPFATPLRFELVVAAEKDSEALKGLGTYGTIKDAVGFIIGAAGKGEKNLEDFGHAMETIILYVTSIGLGSCWLGGNFRKSRFTRKINATVAEIVPAVAAIGYPTKESRGLNRLRQPARSSSRLPWAELFFQARFGNPLSKESAGIYGMPLEMLRIAPSSHNYQPWRVIRDGSLFHFFLQRTRGYGPDSLTFRLLGVADLQRIDIGIAMCHFELAARELGLRGNWDVRKPDLQGSGDMSEYVVTWAGEDD